MPYQTERGRIESLFDKKARAVGGTYRCGDELDPRDPTVGSVFVAANTALKSHCFSLGSADSTIIQGFTLPGKSGSIDFLSLPKRDAISMEEMDYIWKRIFNKSVDRRDCVWHTSVARLRGCKYHAYFLPTAVHPLHIRLVHEFHSKNPRNIGLDVPEYPRQCVSTIWVRKRPER